MPNLYELTASSLNYSFADPKRPWLEPDPTRLGEIYGAENYGLIDIDWASRRVRLSLLRSDGAKLTEQTVQLPRR
jgi:alkaline phosphatase D